MNTFVQALQAIFSSPFCIPVFGIMVGMVAIIASFWHKTIIDKSNNQLKQSMLDQGMSAEEIEKVMNAGSGKSKK